MLDIEQVEITATDWFVRLQHRPAADEARKEFARWLLASPRHVQAYLAVVRAWASIGLVQHPPTEELVKAARIEALTPAVPALTRLRRPLRPWIPFAAAAAVALMAFALFRFTAPERALHPTHIQTAVGEQRNVKLADGTLVQVNTDSDIRFDLSDNERRVVLRRGEARFNVAKDASRPFVVVTPRTTMRVLGTVFNVHTDQGQTAVAVFEGRVEVTGTSKNHRAPVGARLVLYKGQQALMTPEGRLLRDAGPPIERMQAWPTRRLIFRGDTVASVVAEFNRYNLQTIRIATPELAGLKVTGTFDADDHASLIRYLEVYERVRSSRAPDGSYMLSRDISRKVAR
jgi:transmembrane sensor